MTLPIRMFPSLALMILPWLTELSAAQPSKPTGSSAAPNGLPRLKAVTKAGAAAPLSASKYTVDDLQPEVDAGIDKTKKNDVDVLLLDTGKEWSRPLRGSPNDVTFASFQVYASQTTIIEVGGARLGVTASSSDGYLQLMYDSAANGGLQWRGLGVIMQAEPHGGQMLAPLPMLTVRLDPEHGVWDLYSDARLIAHDLPLIAAKKADKRFTVKAGTDGAWVCGLVLADESPLYEDDNENGIDDRFEQQQRGALLSKNASLPERSIVAGQWKAHQREKGAPILNFKRPLPDRALAPGSPRQ